MSGLSIDNLFTNDDFNPDVGMEDEGMEESTSEETTEQQETKQETTENNPDTKDNSESVGSEDENIQEKEDTFGDDESNGTSPKSNFYSSIAKAFVEEGVFPNLADDDIKDLDESPEALVKLMNKEIDSRLDERTKRIESLLNGGVQPNIINQYENTLKYLDSIDEDIISEEGDKGENLRKQLIYQDYVNRGYSQKRAITMVDKSIENGNDIEDAKEALKNCKDYYGNEYSKLQQEAKANEEAMIKERQEQTTKLKKDVLESKDLMGNVDVDKSTRQRIFDVMAKPTYRDDEGNYMTELQKYQKENPINWVKNIAICYAMTDGFKDWSKLGKAQAKKEVKKGLRNLEKVINSTKRTSDGNLDLVGGFGGGFNEDTFFGKGAKLDL